MPEHEEMPPVTPVIDTILITGVTGGISSCSGIPSASPFIQQFFVSGKNLQADIAASSTAGFEISLSPTSGFASNLVIPQKGGTIDSVVIYVRSSASASPGSINSNVLLASPGATTQTAPVAAMITNSVTPSVSIATSSNTVCSGSPETFTATVTNAGPTPIYQWLLNGNPIGADTAVLTTAFLQNSDVISCQLTSNASCAYPVVASSNNFTISLIPSIVSSLNISTTTPTSCAGLPVTFTSEQTNGGSDPTYQWYVNGNKVGSDSTAFTSATLSNGDSVYCIMISHLACSSPDTSGKLYTVVYPSPTVMFNPDTIYSNKGSSVLLSPIVSGNISTYQWSPDAGLNNSSIQNPLANPIGENTYQLLITTDYGCKAVSKITIIEERPIQMPNAFSPNGDGHNDVFRIPPGSQIKLEEFDIFNRWGQRVFETRDIGKGWNGMINGSTADTGTYVYMIVGSSIEGKKIILKGTVILFR
jgi:gliding motility-associated-like protein